MIADTSPLNYLLLIGHVALIPALFGRIVLPLVILEELQSGYAPPAVRSFVSALPGWVEIRPTPPLLVPGLQGLDLGEAEAIRLAIAMDAGLLLMDDHKGVLVARAFGLKVTGTLGVLDMGADEGLIEFASAIDKLLMSNFRAPEAVLQTLREKHRSKH